MNKKYKIGFLVSHPIQYNTPLFKEIANHPQIDLTVFYCSDEGIKKIMEDPGFGKMIIWDIPLLEGYKYRLLKNYSPTPSINAGFFGLINLGIVRELRREKFDALIINEWSHLTDILSIISARLLGINTIMRGENPLNHEFRKSRFKVLAKRIILKYLFKIIDCFLFIGQQNKEFYRFYGVPENKLFFAPYAVDNQRFVNAYEKLLKQRNEIRDEIGISQDEIVILFCGKLIDKKRPMDLLIAYEKVRVNNKALIYIGDGILRKRLEDYVKAKELKNVFFLGFRNQTEFPKYYGASDIFVLPSTIGETWGLVVNEAMCFSLPVIVSDMVGCGKDLVRHGENGFIYPVGNMDKLADYLFKLLKSSELREKMGKRSFEIISKWSYKENIEGILLALEYISNIKTNHD